MTTDDLPSLHRAWLRAEQHERECQTIKVKTQLAAQASMSTEDIAASLAAEREWHLASKEADALRAAHFQAQRKAIP